MPNNYKREIRKMKIKRDISMIRSTARYQPLMNNINTVKKKISIMIFDSKCVF